jgi:hypothetical protein
MLPFCTDQQQATWEYGFLLLRRLLQFGVYGGGLPAHGRSEFCDIQ